MADVLVFEQHRGRLFGIAYRMLGSAADAEDILQEAFLRWREVDDDAIRSPAGLLTTIVTRKCIDRLRVLKARREDYPGPWLPEPIATRTDPSTDQAALAESLSLAFLTVLERLNPVQRAVFLLRKVFDFDYDEIALIVEKSETHCRQIARRARERMEEEKPRFEASPEQHLRMTAKFAQAVGTGDLTGLVSLLSQDVTVWSDGGGKAKAALHPIRGRDRCGRFLLGVASKFLDDMSFRPGQINGQPAFIILSGEAIYSVLALELDASGESVAGIRIMRNPDKLRYADGPLRNL